MGWTNRGKQRALDLLFRDATPGAMFHVALVTAATVPGPDTDKFSELTEIPVGNGYLQGGLPLPRAVNSFSSPTEDDVGNRAYTRAKDLVWTASGGLLPASGPGARYAVLTDDAASLPNRDVLAYWDLGADRAVSDGQSLTLQNAELSLEEFV